MIFVLFKLSKFIVEEDKYSGNFIKLIDMKDSCKICLSIFYLQGYRNKERIKGREV